VILGIFVLNTYTKCNNDDSQLCIVEKFIMLSVFMLNAIILSVIMLNAIKVSVMASFKGIAIRGYNVLPVTVVIISLY
jgi:hypothetical protein